MGSSDDRDDDHDGLVQRVINCIDCGGRAHLLTTWPADDPPIPGDILSYRCEDCRDRWALEIAEPSDSRGDLPYFP